MLSKDVLQIDAHRVTEEIAQAIRSHILTLHRRGVVVGLSGGIDSSVVTSLCAHALGAERVHVLLMPDRDSSAESLTLGRQLSKQLGISMTVEDLTEALTAIGCYTRQDEAIRELFPEYGPGCKFKVTLPSILDGDRFNISELTIETSSGQRQRARIPAVAYRQIVAATNFKQRLRKTMEYYHADRLHYAVAGTPNRLEYDQGFFVKLGDGAADLKPIAHLYKTRCTPSPSISVFRKKFGGVPQLPIRSHFLRRRKSSTSHSLTRRWIAVSTDAITVCPRTKWHQPSS
jgi:NAD+ synthase